MYLFRATILSVHGEIQRAWLNTSDAFRTGKPGWKETLFIDGYFSDLLVTFGGNIDLT